MKVVTLSNKITIYPGLDILNMYLSQYYYLIKCVIKFFINVPFKQ